MPAKKKDLKLLFVKPCLRPGGFTKLLPVGLASVMTYFESKGYNFTLLDIDIDELSDDVFGVVSTQPAYLMNSKSGDDATHPPIALSGRVVVTVAGGVKKGDRLVSAGDGPCTGRDRLAGFCAGTRTN